MKKYTKKIITTAIILASISNVYALSATEEQQSSANILKQMNIFQGYEDGTLGLENNITRAEFATLVARMLGENLSSKAENIEMFSDIDNTHWAYNAIISSIASGYIKGYKDGTFKPSEQITYPEAITIIMRLIGYKDESLEGNWPHNYINKATEIGVLANMQGFETTTKITRGDVAILIKNALTKQLQ